MPAVPDNELVLRTSAGDFPLHEYRLPLGERSWSLLHTGAILTASQEAAYLDEPDDRRPYGVVLWPAAIAMAHELVARGAELAGRRVLELGAGIGLPGLVAASYGARVVQTDRQEIALAVCRRNADRNGIGSVERRLLDWTADDLDARFDYIIGSDICYAPSVHESLARLFDARLAPGGRVLLSDPFRAASLPLLEALERDGWHVALTKWSLDVDGESRPVGVYELTRAVVSA